MNEWTKAATAINHSAAQIRATNIQPANANEWGRESVCVRLLSNCLRMCVHVYLCMYISNSDESCSFLMSMSICLHVSASLSRPVCVCVVPEIDDDVDDAVEKQIKSNQLLCV